MRMRLFVKCALSKAKPPCSKTPAEREVMERAPPCTFFVLPGCFPCPPVFHESTHECMSRNITSRRMPGIEEQLELARTGEELGHASRCHDAMLCESECFHVAARSSVSSRHPFVIASVLSMVTAESNRTSPAPSRWHLMIRVSSS